MPHSSVRPALEGPGRPGTSPVGTDPGFTSVRGQTPVLFGFVLWGLSPVCSKATTPRYPTAKNLRYMNLGNPTLPRCVAPLSVCVGSSATPPLLLRTLRKDPRRKTSSPVWMTTSSHYAPGGGGRGRRASLRSPPP
jgi:hypothetical protein